MYFPIHIPIVTSPPTFLGVKCNFTIAQYVVRNIA